MNWESPRSTSSSSISRGPNWSALKGLGEARLGALLGVELEIGMTGIYPEAAEFSAIHEFMTGMGSSCTTFAWPVRACRIADDMEPSD